MSRTKKQNYKKQKQRKHTAVHATIFALVSVFIILVLTVIELHPVKSVPAWGGPEESLALATVTGKVFAAANQRNGDLCQILFTPAEVNALLAMIQRMYANAKKPSDPPIYAKWENGCSNTACSIKFAGIYLNFYLQIVPSYNNGKLYMQIADCRVGKLPLPAAITEKALNKELAKQIQKDQRLQSVLSLLHCLRVEKSGEVQVEILRKNSGKLLRSFF